MSDFSVGVDLARTTDFTAAAVLQVNRSGDSGPRLAVRHLERLELGTPYPRQVERIRTLYNKLSLLGVPEGVRPRHTVQLVVDATGVGRPVIDLLREHLDVTAVNITAGTSVTRVGPRDVNVPKADLIGALTVAVQTKRLRIAAAAPLARVLVDELLGFRMSVSDSGRARFGNDVGEWRQAAHDDLVLAMSLAVWQADQVGGFTSLTFGRA